MAKWFDCATPLTASVAAAFAANGYEGVARYLVPSGWKHLSADEARDVTAAGLKLVSAFETTANRALSGYQGGKEDGCTAAECAASVGQSEGSAIYFAVDFEPTDGQLAIIVEYIRGASEATPGYLTGVYGCARVMRACMAAGVCSRYWQCKAWSNGAIVPGIHLYQSKIDFMESGIGIDSDIAYDGVGWWNTCGEYEGKETGDGPMDEQAKKTNFPDVEAGRWSEDAITIVSRNGIMTGYEDGTFKPGQAVTREELAKVVNDLLFLISKK